MHSRTFERPKVSQDLHFNPVPAATTLGWLRERLGDRGSSTGVAVPAGLNRFSRTTCPVITRPPLRLVRYSRGSFGRERSH